jgi:AraC-like DNA-binding protein
MIERGMEQVCSTHFEGSIHAGQYSVVGPGVEHSSWSTSRPVQECIIHIPKNRIELIAADMHVRLGDWTEFPMQASPLLQHLVESMKHCAREPDAPGKDLLLESVSSALVVLLLQQHMLVDTSNSIAVDDNSAGVHRAEELMRAQLTESLSLDELARAAKMGKFHFLRSFKRQFKQTPYAYLMQLRLDRAAQLIDTTELSLTDIAYDAGFGSSSRLSEAFKQRYGVLPSQHRRQRNNRKAVGQ